MFCDNFRKCLQKLIFSQNTQLSFINVINKQKVTTKQFKIIIFAV